MAKQRNSNGSLLFTKDDYETLRRIRHDLNDFIAKCDKAEACGLDCSFLRATRDSLEQQLASIEMHFMTPPPSR